MKSLLYVAAPYTDPDPVANTHAVCKLATEIYESTPWCPVVPHLAMIWHTVTPRPYDHWLDYCLILMRRCDAIVRLPGKSYGADREMIEAADAGLRVLDYGTLPEAVRQHWR